MRNGGEEECCAEPDLSRLALVAPAQHGHDCGEEEDRRQTGLQRSDSLHQPLITQRVKDRPYDGRDRGNGRGSQGAGPRAILPAAAKGEEEDRRRQGLGNDPRKCDERIADIL